MKLHFSLNWKITLASLLFLPLLLSLGFWQLSRAEEKHTILEQWQQQQAQPAIDITTVENANSQQNLRVSGKFDREHYWLYEGRFFEGHLGFEVLMPFETTHGEWLLVNRGWVSATAYRDVLPEFNTPANEVTLLGYLVTPNQFDLLDDVKDTENRWPRYALEIDLENMAASYGNALHKRMLQLAPESQAALAVNPQAPINMPPERHRAYAFQWFSLAVALIILWFVASTNIVQLIRKKEESV